MKEKRRGLTIFESVVLIVTCAVLLWVIVPVLLVRGGFKEAGAMVVNEGEASASTPDKSVLESRITVPPKREVIANDKDPAPPTLPKRAPLE